MKEIVQKILADPRYLENIEYGEPRSGHPEGKIKNHIADLVRNLEAIKPRGLSGDEYWKLMFLIHVHDTFKAEAVPDVPILDPRSHASLARKYAGKFRVDRDLLNMVQFHDENYALWHQFNKTGAYDTQRFQRLLGKIKDWDLFLKFIIIDGSTEGKERSKLIWFIQEVRKYKETAVDESWVP